MYGIKKPKVSASRTRTKSTERRLTKRKPTKPVVPPHSSKPKRRRQTRLPDDLWNTNGVPVTLCMQLRLRITIFGEYYAALCWNERASTEISEVIDKKQ
ncbi:unnamed protein product [Trichobilharzia szidati]|nr:unnamed protein product [Trichobilharzia szidati]